MSTCGSCRLKPSGKKQPRPVHAALPLRHPKRGLITDIALWTECFTMLAAALSARYPDKAPHLMAYLLTLVRAIQNFRVRHGPRMMPPTAHRQPTTSVTVICIPLGNVCPQTHFPSDTCSSRTDITGILGNISVSDICFPELTVPHIKVFIPRQDLYNAEVYYHVDQH